ncbi:hypothetical protein N7451_011028 [Penicillium sp. IBT 35674x]|nr:hypothetical protein N7451_011028 [Penicillium sp. IBT 35674x]
MSALTIKPENCNTPGQPKPVHIVAHDDQNVTVSLPVMRVSSGESGAPSPKSHDATNWNYAPELAAQVHCLL